MTTITQAFGFNLAELNQAGMQGLVSTKPHGELTIYNYTKKTQYAGEWNNITLNARGLILKGNEIVGRGFPKFFNYTELDLNLDDSTVVDAYNKLDGILGIVYKHEGKLNIATRGRLDSDITVKATQILDSQESVLNPELLALTGQTLLCEIIYPEGRIILDYGSEEKLVLLGAIDNATGEFTPPQDIVGWNGERAERKKDITFGEVKSLMSRENAEGWVVHHGSSVFKMKQEDYLAAARASVGLSVKNLWKAFAHNGVAPLDFLNAPDESYDDIRRIYNHFIAQRAELSEEYDAIEADGPTYQREFAYYAQGFEHPALLFAKRRKNMKAVNRYLWSQVEPEPNIGFKRFIEKYNLRP